MVKQITHTYIKILDNQKSIMYVTSDLKFFEETNGEIKEVTQKEYNNFMFENELDLTNLELPNISNLFQ